MATMNPVQAWIEGARLRTLPAAATPVLVGTAAAHALSGANLARAFLAMIVALALQVGVNYANDYSDGIRGTDSHRTDIAKSGPVRLVGSGVAKPKTVLLAALGCFAVAGVAGLALVTLAGTWWMLAVGVAAVAAAWFYTGGKKPYGYMGIGLSEFFVFLFFGLVATVGTTWTQVYRAPWWLWVLASALGLMSIAMLLANNLRDIDTDRASGKRTLVVRLGLNTSLTLFFACVFIPALSAFVVAVPLASVASWVMWVAFCACIAWLLTLAFLPYMKAKSARTAPQWVKVLKLTGIYMLMWAAVVVSFLFRAGVS